MASKHHPKQSYVRNYLDGWRGIARYANWRWTTYIEKGTFRQRCTEGVVNFVTEQQVDGVMRY
ncbi:MAG: hypothetical protein M3R24_14710 [Chloroflexota bacterium]|nr:hypothetical protein [Chloroflexota bacterium]